MDRVYILNSPVRSIRNLTSAECANLRAEGVSCSPAWIVSPDGSGSGGHLYSPTAEGGHNNAGIYARHSYRYAISQKSKENTNNKIVLLLSTETDGVIVGLLYRGNEHLLSSNNPTTIAAAIFAMGECEFSLWTKTEWIILGFPTPVGNMYGAINFIYNKDQADFLWGLAKSSWFDFLNPHPADILGQAKFHLIEAVSQLRENLVRNGPSSSEPQGFTEELKTGERRSPFAPD